MTLSHDDLRSLLAASALNALPEDEAEQLERHLKRCSHCRAEMVEFGSAAALLAGQPQEAPPGTWEGIVATIEQSPPRAMPGSLRRVVRKRSWWVQGWAVAAAAALIAVVVLAISTASLQGDVTHLQNQASAGNLNPAVAAALGTKGRRVVDLRNNSGIELAEAVVTPGGGSFLVPEAMSPLSTGRTYQLWALSRGDPVSLGVLGGRPGITAFRVEAGMTTLMITAEPEGGVPAPTNGVLAQGGIVA
jgi:Anti-sigma-K factor rskA/Putative zinc-finger